MVWYTIDEKKILKLQYVKRHFQKFLEYIHFLLNLQQMVLTWPKIENKTISMIF